MAINLTDAEIRRRICAKTKWARENEGRSQQEMADMLGISRDRYSKYEWRTPIHSTMVAHFCLITKVDHDWLLNPFVLPPGEDGKATRDGPEKKKKK